MNKGVVFALVFLAAIVLISPALVGRLAEKSMDESINWAATESGEVTVTSEHFDRGWFSSEGQHRIELRDGQLKTMVQSAAGSMPDDEVPVLLINTRIDHGLIPVSSMSREKGSLTPGLGDAISTLQLELPDGRIIDLPGAIYSKVGLTGVLQSNYLLEEGARVIDDVNLSWDDADITVTTNPTTRVAGFEGTVGAASIGNFEGGMGLSGLSFKGMQRQTRFGLAVGRIEATMDELSIAGSYGQSADIRDFAVTAHSELDGDRVNGSATVVMALSGAQFLENLGVDLVFELEGADAASLGAMQKTMKQSGPDVGIEAIQDDLRTLFAKGFTFNLPKYNLEVPQGTIASELAFTFSEDDPATFEWTSLLLTTKGAVDISIPAELVEAYAQNNQQAAMVIGGGYLVKRGEVYVSEARMEKGLLTINGAPIPIPFGPY